jgi:hypothetical protein
MTPETRRDLRALFKKIAVVCLLLAALSLAWMYFVSEPNLQLAWVAIMLLASGGAGYRYASTAGVWTATPWLKGLVCVLGALAGAATFAAAVAIGSFTYVVVSGGSSNGSSGGDFSTRSFD